MSSDPPRRNAAAPPLPGASGRRPRGGWVAAALLWCLAGAAGAAEGTAEAGVVSRHVWRGRIRSRGAAAQSSVTVAGGRGLAFETWASLDLSGRDPGGDAGRKRSFTDLELTLTFAPPLEGPLGAVAGLTERLPLFGEESEREAWAAVTLAGVLTLSAHHEFRRGNGTYAALSAVESLALFEGAALSFVASVGAGDPAYNEAAFGRRETLWNDGQLGAELELSLGEDLALRAGAQHVALLDRRLRAAARASGGGSRFWVYGIHLRRSF